MSPNYEENKFERISRDELESAKFKKLKKQINYVFKHSPFIKISSDKPEFDLPIYGFPKI